MHVSRSAKALHDSQLPVRCDAECITMRTAGYAGNHAIHAFITKSGIKRRVAQMIAMQYAVEQQMVFWLQVASTADKEIDVMYILVKHKLLHIWRHSHAINNSRCRAPE